jgi:hypothetical protein
MPALGLAQKHEQNIAMPGEFPRINPLLPKPCRA